MSSPRAPNQSPKNGSASAPLGLLYKAPNGTTYQLTWSPPPSATYGDLARFCLSEVTQQNHYEARSRWTSEPSESLAFGLGWLAPGRRAAECWVNGRAVLPWHYACLEQVRGAGVEVKKVEASMCAWVGPGSIVVSEPGGVEGGPRAGAAAPRAPVVLNSLVEERKEKLEKLLMGNGRKKSELPRGEELEGAALKFINEKVRGRPQNVGSNICSSR